LLWDYDIKNWAYNYDFVPNSLLVRDANSTTCSFPLSDPHSSASWCFNCAQGRGSFKQYSANDDSLLMSCMSKDMKTIGLTALTNQGHVMWSLPSAMNFDNPFPYSYNVVVGWNGNYFIPVPLPDMTRSNVVEVDYQKGAVVHSTPVNIQWVTVAFADEKIIYIEQGYNTILAYQNS
jgi:hypothetical protein